jgi:3-deoxy-D-arabino-heptulosonate 7-phosphate (DAHP) synthase
MHPEPEKALSDGYQSLDPDQFAEMAEECKAIHDLLAARRNVPAPVR